MRRERSITIPSVLRDGPIPGGLRIEFESRRAPRRGAQLVVGGALLALGAAGFAAPAASAAVTLGCTGAPQTYTVPDGAESLKLNVLGAEGGHPQARGGSLGARVFGTLAVAGGQTLQVNVGCHGKTDSSPAGNRNGSGGGGSSDVRTGAFALSDRRFVAGGGGGAGGNSSTGFGGEGGPGGTSFAAGGNGGFVGVTGGQGASATAPGSAGASLFIVAPALGAAPGQSFLGGVGATVDGSLARQPGGFGGGGAGGAGTPSTGQRGGGGGGGGGVNGGGGGGAAGLPSVGGAIAGAGGGGGSSSGPPGAQFRSGVHQDDGEVTITPISGPQTFGCIRATQTYTVPSFASSLTLDVQGAQGGASAISLPGGLGGRVVETLPVTPGQVLQVNVGCQGGTNPSPGGTFHGNGGGGGSDVRTGTFSLAERQIVAGGGGGTGGTSNLTRGGAGGQGGGGVGADGTTGITGGGGGGATRGGAGGLNNGAMSGATGALFSGGRGAGTLSGIPGAGGYGGGANGGTGFPSTGQRGGGGGGGGGLYGGGGGATGGLSATRQPDAAGGGGGGGSNFGLAGAVFSVGVRAGDGQVTITAVGSSTTA